ncbi:MAG: bifunctional 5,10-methylenetetrahydrofolate dehydrogenase/5,10-methenyltetrahydrofolate cyclohydrolase [Thermoplasmata archaeon]|nr:bifunctional 5,10-methylenetetrahydrofolate dehydrogenase/5,10-methenyltetrahydrofolate cyclohydrolase [Thermoplasmata archaeon]
MTERLQGAPVAETIDRATREALREGGERGTPPCLASIHRGLEGPFRLYLNRQRRAAETLGIRFREETLAPSEGPAGLRARARSLDGDPSVHAVLVEHPLPTRYEFQSAVDELRPTKDVDGVGTKNLGQLVGGRPEHAPAVALAALAIARHYHLPLDGAPVAIIGRSGTVGLPLALLLAQRSPGPNATVTVAHTGTRDLARALAGARTVFSCAGAPNLLNRSVVPKEAAVIDIGLSTLPDPSRATGVRIVGDADLESLDGWASSVTPVPGGVGPVTVAELMRSTVRSWQAQPGGGPAP